MPQILIPDHKNVENFNPWSQKHWEFWSLIPKTFTILIPDSTKTLLIPIPSVVIPDPGAVIPDLIYLVTTLIIGHFLFPLHWFISLVNFNFLLSFPKCNRRHGALFSILQVTLSLTGQPGNTICTQAFLFSLANPDGLEPTKLPLKSNSHQCAILYSSGNGPTFGNVDLHIADNANTSSSSSSILGRAYEKPPAWKNTSLAGERNFVVTNYEVFGFQPWLKTDHTRAISGTLCRSRANESNLFSWRKLSGNNLLKTAFFLKEKCFNVSGPKREVTQKNCLFVLNPV